MVEETAEHPPVLQEMETSVLQELPIQEVEEAAAELVQVPTLMVHIVPEQMAEMAVQASVEYGGTNKENKWNIS
jgi:hypothetical protein